MKKYPEASASYEYAVKIGKKVLPPTHPTLKIYQDNLKSAQSKVKK
jgi:hypothetical protein